MKSSADLIALLERHLPTDAAETASRTKMVAFLARTTAPCARSTLEGHVTASAVVLDPAGRALLLFHARLSAWLQPGGHIEPGEDPPTAALRETREETGLTDLQLECDDSGTPRLLDVDVHPIPAHPTKPEPAHWHYDLCFVARTRQPDALRIDSRESGGGRWMTAAEVEAQALDPATKRRLRKARLAAG